MRNCARTDLGHDEPYETNPRFDMALGRTFRVRQCPIPLITEFSRTLLEIFFACHSKVPGWSGIAYVQHCWPTARTLWEERYLFVHAFKIIENEILEVQSERRE